MLGVCSAQRKRVLSCPLRSACSQRFPAALRRDRALFIVKGTHLFAFPPGSTKGSTPKFAVPLADLAAEVESDPHKVLVYKKLHGGAEYVLRFEDEDQVAPFCKAIKAGAELAALDRIKDNLGHPRPPRTDSTLYADKVGKEFASKQPEHEVTAADASAFAAQGVAPGVGPVYH